MGKRQPIPAPDTWQQLELVLTSPEQRIYEVLRPIVLFGQSAAERARETNTLERTLNRQVLRFEARGMASLFPVPPTTHRELPANLRHLILELKAEHLPFRPHELATICYVRLGRRPSPHTIKRVLGEHVVTPPGTRRFPPYHQIANPVERRRAVLRLHSEGWNKKSIADYLQITRVTVYETLRRWAEEGVAGLFPKSRRPKRPVRKVTLTTLARILTLQRNPRLGAFRIHAALKQEGIDLSPATCGRILAVNRRLYKHDRPAVEHAKKTMPFAAQRRHQFWSIDIRYLDMHQLGGGNIYCFCILENYSRMVLAWLITRTQDLTAYLMVLYAAIEAHGCPKAIVTDGGSVFQAKHVQHIYRTLGIRHERIEKRKPWQNYIETMFNVQRRMADWHFVHATRWEELQGVQGTWSRNYNEQVHSAHRKREDGAQTPATVLGEGHGTRYDPVGVRRIFYTLRFGRVLDKAGYIRFRRWKIYGEQGLAGKAADVWVYKSHLTIAYADPPLATYEAKSTVDGHSFQSITEPQLYPTQYQSPQIPLWELSNEEWLKAVQMYGYRPRRRHSASILQLALPLEEHDQAS